MHAPRNLLSLIFLVGCDMKVFDEKEEKESEESSVSGGDADWSDGGGGDGGGVDGDIFGSTGGSDGGSGMGATSGGGGGSSAGSGDVGGGTGTSDGAGGDDGVGLDDGGASDGEPGVDKDQPIAVCSVAPDVIRPIADTAIWNGEDSYDPTELRITYDWTLAYRPDGSEAEMPAGTMTSPTRAGFSADLAGEYVGRLVVTNSDGVRSEPCEATLTVEPAEALWIEMFWENAGDDMDLHLLANGAEEDADGDGVADGLKTTDDCYYSNCTASSLSGGLDWGVEGDTIDDPILDLDDISETGPENINIEMPADGLYTVVVHDYPGSVYDAGNAVTVNIYIDGVLEWTDTRIITTEDSYTNFAAIDTRAGTVTSL